MKGLSPARTTRAILKLRVTGGISLAVIPRILIKENNLSIELEGIEEGLMWVGGSVDKVNRRLSHTRPGRTLI
jgi:hypothetical protein